MNGIEFKTLANSFSNVEEKPHFDRIAFRSVKRIFATYHEPSNSANIKLTIPDQDVFCIMGNGSVYQVPNKWGIQGWTTFDLTEISRELLMDALKQSYMESLK